MTIQYKPDYGPVGLDHLRGSTAQYWTLVHVKGPTAELFIDNEKFVYLFQSYDEARAFLSDKSIEGFSPGSIDYNILGTLIMDKKILSSELNFYINPTKRYKVPKSRGGARPGAGRPPKGYKVKKLHCGDLSPDDHENIKKYLPTNLRNIAIRLALAASMATTADQLEDVSSEYYTIGIGLGLRANEMRLKDAPKTLADLFTEEDK